MPLLGKITSINIRQAHLFVAVLGASSLSFAQASWTETLPDWVDAHARASAFFGEVTRLLILDNAKVAVIKACLYDPQVNRTYAEMAAHYGTAVVPRDPTRGPKFKPPDDLFCRFGKCGFQIG